MAADIRHFFGVGDDPRDACEAALVACTVWLAQRQFPFERVSLTSQLVLDKGHWIAILVLLFDNPGELSGSFALQPGVDAPAPTG
jgi:hypothetical protein